MRIRVFLIFLLPLLFLLLTIRTVLRFLRRRKRVQNADAAAEGTVTKVRCSKVQREYYQFTAAVRYKVDGQTYHTKFKPLPQNTPDCSVRKGDAVTVHYQTGFPAEGFVQRETYGTDIAGILCTVMPLFFTVMLTDSLIRWDIGWFTLPERRLIGAIRLILLALMFLAPIVLSIWVFLKSRRSEPYEGTIREIRQFGRQTVLCTEYEINGDKQIIPLLKGAADKRNYAVGDRIRFRMAGGLLIGMEREKSKGESIANCIFPVIGSVLLFLMLLEDLQRLLKM